MRRPPMRLSSRTMSRRLGVDIGGTFTDLVLAGEATGAIRVGKILTPPKDPARAVESGIQSLLAESDVRADAVRAVARGITLATSALSEREGARTVLITTARRRKGARASRPARVLDASTGVGA